MPIAHNQVSGPHMLYLHRIFSLQPGLGLKSHNQHNPMCHISGTKGHCECQTARIGIQSWYQVGKACLTQTEDELNYTASSNYEAYPSSVRLTNRKGPKHETRLKAARGYFIDETVASLPLTSQPQLSRPNTQEQQSLDDNIPKPYCYEMPRCIKSKSSYRSEKIVARKPSRYHRVKYTDWSIVEKERYTYIYHLE